MDGELIQEAFNFISKHENVVKSTYTAQYDVSRYSIGFGTISYVGEIISYEEAKRRSIQYITNEIIELQRWLPFNDLNDNQKIAVLDYAYQWGVPNFKNSGFANRIKDKWPINLQWAQSDPNFFKWAGSSRALNRLNKFNQDEQNIENISFYGGLGLIALFIIIYKFIV